MKLASLWQEQYQAMVMVDMDNYVGIPSFDVFSWLRESDPNDPHFYISPGGACYKY